MASIFLTNWSRRLPHVGGVFIICQILESLLVPIGLRRLRIPRNQHSRWAVHVVSLVHAIVITIESLKCMQLLKPDDFDSPAKRMNTVSTEISYVQGLLLGYECWQLGALARRPNTFPRGTLTHCLLNLCASSVTMIPSGHYYTPRAALVQSTTIFVQVHWVLDQLGLHDSIQCRVNDMMFISSFTGVRLYFNTLLSYNMMRDSFVLWSLNRTTFPSWLGLTYVFAMGFLCVLNFYWATRVVRNDRFNPMRSSSSAIAAVKAPHGRGMDVELLKTVWAQVLDVPAEGIQPSDDFFHLGGDSMAVLQLITLCASNGISLTVPNITRHSTLSGMVANAETRSISGLEYESPKPFILLGKRRMLARTKAASICGVSYSSILDIYPCLPFQAAQMSLGAREPGTFIFRASYKIGPQLDLHLFCRALETLVKEHPILRTRIIKLDQFPLQVVLDEELQWLRYSSMISFHDEAHDKMMTYGNRLSHFALVQDGKDTTFVWTIHHALMDGWSFSLLLQELKRIYGGATPTQFYPFSRVLYDVVQAGANDTLQYWAARLKDASPSHLPGVPGSHLGRTDKAHLESISLEHGSSAEVTMATIIWSAWAFVLTKLTGRSDTVFGLLLSGRNSPIPGVQQTTGPTISVIPVRTILHHATKVQEYLAHCQQQSVERIPYEQIPFAMFKKNNPAVLEACNFQTQLFVQPKGNYRRVDGILGEQGAIELHRMSFAKPVALEVFMEDTSIDVVGHYDSKVISAEKMQSIIQDLAAAIRALLTADPDTNVGDVLSQLG